MKGYIFIIDVKMLFLLHADLNMKGMVVKVWVAQRATNTNETFAHIDLGFE